MPVNVTFRSPGMDGYAVGATFLKPLDGGRWRCQGCDDTFEDEPVADPFDFEAPRPPSALDKAIAHATVAHPAPPARYHYKPAMAAATVCGKNKDWVVRRGDWCGNSTGWVTCRKCLHWLRQNRPRTNTRSADSAT